MAELTSGIILFILCNGYIQRFVAYSPPPPPPPNHSVGFGEFRKMNITLSLISRCSVLHVNISRYFCVQLFRNCLFLQSPINIKLYSVCAPHHPENETCLLEMQKCLSGTECTPYGFLFQTIVFVTITIVF